MRIYVDTQTGTYGDASSLVILTEAAAERFLLLANETTDDGKTEWAKTIGRRAYDPDAWLD